MGDSALATARTRTCSPTRDRGGLHLAAEHDALRVVDQGRRGREARAVREADVAPSRGGRGGVRRGRAHRPDPLRGVHVAPQPAGGAARRRWWPDGAIGELRLVRSAFSYSLYDADNIRLRTDLEGGALMDVGLLLRERLEACSPASRRRVYGAALVRARRGTDWVFAGTMRFPGDVLAQFDCGTALPEPRRARGDRERGLALPRRPVACADAGDRGAARATRSSGSSTSRSIRIAWSSRTCSDAIRGEGELLLGREDAVAQSRVLEALHRSAETGLPV